MTPQDTQLLTAIGVISGTSMDGIDVAVLASDGRERVRTGPARSYPYPAALRSSLQDLITAPERAMSDPLPALEAGVTAAHLAAIRAFMADFAISPSDVDLIGLHGQTVYHRPDLRFTRQLGDGAVVARETGLTTVDRFRHADVAAGGEGAPLVPLYHRALAQGLAQPLMVLNLGGVANVTYIDGETVIAFDTGPASALLDDFMLKRRGLAYDADGALAASGQVDTQLVAAFLQNPYFDRKPPKSLDRNEFHRRAQVVEALSDADGAATLAAFTVESILAALRHVPRAPRHWLVAGGGRLNRHLMTRLEQQLGVSVRPVEAVGWMGDDVEAQCFAYLAIRALKGLPLSLPTTTGVAEPLTGGRISRP